MTNVAATTPPLEAFNDLLRRLVRQDRELRLLDERIAHFVQALRYEAGERQKALSRCGWRADPRLGVPTALFVGEPFPRGPWLAQVRGLAHSDSAAHEVSSSP